MRELDAVQQTLHAASNMPEPLAPPHTCPTPLRNPTWKKNSWPTCQDAELPREVAFVLSK